MKLNARAYFRTMPMGSLGIGFVCLRVHRKNI